MKEYFFTLYKANAMWLDYQVKMGIKEYTEFVPDTNQGIGYV